MDVVCVTESEPASADEARGSSRSPPTRGSHLTVCHSSGSRPIDRPRHDVRLDNAAVVTDTSTNDTFEVAFVCTGNRARSALSEALYRRYALGFDTSARSFGTLDVAGASALEQAV